MEQGNLSLQARERLKCDECDKILVEVLDKDRDGNPILNADNEPDFRKYPVYIKEQNYYKAHHNDLCTKCYNEEKANPK